MKQYQIPPFYFPTTVIFVDDSTVFLENLSFQLDPQLAFQLYESPINEEAGYVTGQVFAVDGGMAM